MIDLRSSLTELKDYASYLRNTHLEQVAAEYLQLVRKQKLPLLKFYDHLSEKELQGLARQKAVDFLEQVVKNQFLEAVRALMNRWQSNQLTELCGKDIQTEDVLFFYNLQKEAVLHFLPFYTQDVSLAIRIVSQLDALCKEAQRYVFDAYVNLQQQALKQSQAQLSEAQETAHIGSWEWNLSTNQVAWSDEMYRIAGFTPGEIAVDAQAYLQLLHDEDRSATVAAIGKCLSALEPYALEHRIVCKDSSIRWMLCKGKVVLSAEGHVERLIGVAIDITELKSAEKQLRELNEQLEQRVAQRTEELQAAHDQIQELLSREKTARIQAQQQHQQVERLFMQAPVAIAIYQLPNFVVELANEAMCQLWGKRQQTVLGKPLFESVPYLKGLGYQERLEGVLSTGTSAVGNEIPVSAMRNGKLEQVYLTFIHQPIRDNTGTIISIISIVHEVTQQVVARQKIEASEARVQRLLDSMPQIAWTSNREGSNTYLNQQWYQFTGTRYAENFDETWPLYIHPDDVAGIREQRRASLATGEFCQFEYRIRNKAGEYRWHLGRILPLLDEKGNLVEWVGTATDIHEQKTRIDYLYKVLESIPHLAWTSSPEKSSVNFYNKGWYEYTGLTQEQSADQGWQLVLHSEDKQGTVATITEGRMRNEPWSVENRYKRFDGTYRWHVSRAVPIFDEQGRVTLWVGTATDIDDQRRTLEELQQTLKELHEKNFELDQFVYKTSHDLRSPLSTILGLINILKQEPEEATRRHYVDLIENRVHKLDRFIHSMLDYSRNTRTAARHEQIHFEDIYKECLDALEYMKNFSRLQISLHLEEGILYSDVFRLKIIFSNLISNAIKYQDFNKQLSTLRVQVRFQNQQVELLFADNGVGIEQAYQDKIYDMFFRATEQADGSGLGLYIVKQAVAVLSGKIELQSQVGIGTSFLITMPIHCTT